MKKVETQARKLLAEALMTTTKEIPLDIRFDQSERWDSLAHMRIVLAVEALLGRSLETSEILSIESLASIAEILAKKS